MFCVCTTSTCKVPVWTVVVLLEHLYLIRVCTENSNSPNTNSCVIFTYLSQHHKTQTIFYSLCPCCPLFFAPVFHLWHSLFTSLFSRKVFVSFISHRLCHSESFPFYLRWASPLKECLWLLSSNKKKSSNKMVFSSTLWKIVF